MLRHLAMFICVMGLVSSCSWITKRRTLFNNDNPEDQTVPKNQYDQLLDKYQTLLKERENQGPGSETGLNSERVDLVQDLNRVAPGSGDLVETVDVFAEKGGATAAVAGAAAEYDQQRISDDMKKLEAGKSALEANKFDEALKLLKEAEVSPAKPIHVRAKYLLAEMLFRQGEFDLSMQIFEEILARDAHSSVVLSALGRLVVCAEKLKLSQKRERYHSLLNDILTHKG